MESDEVRELGRLDAEYGNVSASLAFASPRNPDLTATIAASLNQWWVSRGRLAELEQWVQPLLGREITRSSRARVLSALISIALNREAADRLQAYGAELLPLARELGADMQASGALLALGFAAFTRSDIEQGRTLLLEAVDLARTAGPTRVPSYLGNLGWSLRGAGKLAEAREILEEALALGRRQASPNRLALILAQRANLALDEGQLDEALSLCRELGLRQRVPICLSGLSATLARLGQPDDAVRIGAAADRIAEEMTLWSAADEQEDEQSLELRRRLGEERYETLAAEGRSLSEEDAIALALSAALGVTTAPR